MLCPSFLWVKALGWPLGEEPSLLYSPLAVLSQRLKAGITTPVWGVMLVIPTIGGAFVVSLLGHHSISAWPLSVGFPGWWLQAARLPTYWQGLHKTNVLRDRQTTSGGWIPFASLACEGTQYHFCCILAGRSELLRLPVGKERITRHLFVGV